jgi:nucleoside-diphosphate-sugar epimerase
MKVLVLGGTSFIGRRIVECLSARGDEVAVFHRGLTEPERLVPVRHIHADRHAMSGKAAEVRDFGPDAVLDSNALTGADVDAVTSVLPDVPSVVLSSQDVYQAVAALRRGTCEAAVPLDEQAELRSERHPYAGRGYAGVPDDYDKLDVEERWLPRGAVVLRLPMVYGPHDDQQREAPVLRRVLHGNREVPVGGGALLWTRAHVDDVASAALAALDSRAADGLAVNIGEKRVFPIGTWFRQIADAAHADVSFVTVPDASVPADLSISKNHSQHLLVSVARAHELLDWSASDAPARVRQSVAWHLQYTRFAPWSDEEQARDAAALRERYS